MDSCICTNTEGFFSDLDVNVYDNFSISIFSHEFGMFNSAKMKVCDLWFNTVFLDPNSNVVNFPISELNIKKKYRKKWDSMQITLRFDGATGGNVGSTQRPKGVMKNASISKLQMTTRESEAQL